MEILLEISLFLPSQVDGPESMWHGLIYYKSGNVPIFFLTSFKGLRDFSPRPLNNLILVPTTQLFIFTGKGR